MCLKERLKWLGRLLAEQPILTIITPIVWVMQSLLPGWRSQKSYYYS